MSIHKYPNISTHSTPTTKNSSSRSAARLPTAVSERNSVRTKFCVAKCVLQCVCCSVCCQRLSSERNSERAKFYVAVCVLQCVCCRVCCQRQHTCSPCVALKIRYGECEKYDTLQHTAARCSTLQTSHYNTLQYTATNPLQHTATHLQPLRGPENAKGAENTENATHCNTL